MPRDSICSNSTYTSTFPCGTSNLRTRCSPHLIDPYPHILPVIPFLIIPSPIPSLPRVQTPHLPNQPPLPPLTPNRHLQTIKRILHHIISIQLINSPHNLIRVRLLRFRKQQKLRSCERLEALEAEVFGFEDFDAGKWLGGGRGVEGVEARGYCVDSVMGEVSWGEERGLMGWEKRGRGGVPVKCTG
jgi:hypothetical protein